MSQFFFLSLLFCSFVVKNKLANVNAKQKQKKHLAGNGKLKIWNMTNEMKRSIALA